VKTKLTRAAAGRAPHHIAALALALLLPAEAPGAEGSIEIDQARALAGGVTASDTPGFPVTLGASGSYRLTGNLAVPDENTTAILVDTAAPGVTLFVTLDLAGFEIAGPNACSVELFGVTVDCTLSGSGAGVKGTTGHVLTVRNGTIRGMGDAGIAVAGSALVEGLRLEQNGDGGVSVGAYSIVTENEVSRHRQIGIGVGVASVVSRNSVRFTEDNGIVCTSIACVVRKNHVLDTLGTDVSNAAVWALQGQSVIVDNAITASGGRGILVGLPGVAGASVVSGNAVSDGATGIDTTRGTLAADNAIVDHSGAAIVFNGFVGSPFFPEVIGYSRNLMRDNGSTVTEVDPVNASAVNLGGNLCENDPVCP